MPLLTNMFAGGTIVGVLIELAQVFCVAFGVIGWGIISILSGVSYGAKFTDLNPFNIGNTVDMFKDSTVNSIRDVLFNRSTLTTASFFYRNDSTLRFTMGLDSSIDFSQGIVPKIFQQVSNFYYLMRNLSIAALLFILLYIGIRMAISTVASDEAKYKKMLGNWAVSMALVFVLQFIMIATLYINNTLVSILYRFSGDFKGLEYAALAAEGLVPIVGLGEAVVFAMMVGMELTFILMYVKRVITLAFLIVISPLITITYSIDKIGDNKSQALNTWLKEFIFTVMIQPFHCIIYIVLIQTALSEMAGFEGLGAGVLYIIMLKFMKEAEDIVRKIFGIKSDSMPGFKGMGVMALGVMSKMGSSASKGGSKDSGGKDTNAKMPNMRKEQKKAQQTPPSKTPPSSEEEKKKEEKKLPEVAKSRDFGDRVEGIANRMGGTKGIISKGAQLGGKLAGFGFGLGMTGELDQAIAFSSIAGSTTGKIDDALTDFYNNTMLDENEDVLKHEFDRYAQDGMRGDDPRFADKEEAYKQFMKIVKKVEKDEKEDIDNVDDIKKVPYIESMLKSVKVAGYSDPKGYIEDMLEQHLKDKP